MAACIHTDLPILVLTDWPEDTAVRKESVLQLKEEIQVYNYYHLTRLISEAKQSWAWLMLG
jgi:hypothetical protein